MGSTKQQIVSHLGDGNRSCRNFTSNFGPNGSY